MNDTLMEKKEKCLYETPVLTVLEVKQEGVLCVSGTRNGYGESIEDEWE